MQGLSTWFQNNSGFCNFNSNSPYCMKDGNHITISTGGLAETGADVSTTGLCNVGTSGASYCSL